MQAMYHCKTSDTINNPYPIKALSLHLFDAYVFKGEDTPDLDFVLCHSNSTPNDFDGSSANPDRNRFADYSWLDAGTKPQFDMETPLTVRVQGLVEWIQRSYIKKCTGELSSTLGNINSKLSFDYDSYLRTISGADGRCVEGVVQDSIDHTCLALSIPLLQEKNEKICEDLGGILELYGKLTGLGGGGAPSVAKVEISLLMVLMMDRSSVNVKALREEVEIEAKGTEGWVEISIAELVRRVISLQGLPRHTGQFQKTLQRSSVCMMDFIPFLESALLNCLWEPLHFLQLVDHLTLLFGLPLDVNMGVDTTSAQGAQVSRTATFSYVCEEPQASALIVLRYNNSRTVPVVEVTVTQQTDPAKKEKTTSKHVKYRDDLDPKSKSSSISSGPIDVALLGEATIAACMETIVSLIKPCKRA